VTPCVRGDDGIGSAPDERTDVSSLRRPIQLDGQTLAN
jgi:hypothetical protein